MKKDICKLIRAYIAIGCCVSYVTPFFYVDKWASLEDHNFLWLMFACLIESSVIALAWPIKCFCYVKKRLSR